MNKLEKETVVGYVPVSLCPECKKGDLREDLSRELLACSICSSTFPIYNGRPVVLRTDNPLFSVHSYQMVRSPVSERRELPYLSSINLSRVKMLKSLRKALEATEGKKVVLVVGSGTQRKELSRMLGLEELEYQTFYLDIDVNADVDIFCDAHDLPFKSNTVDAVITTAVLEHVMYPERAAAEITRVLRVGGMLYSELPFMQQVHEGAYDFTRYSMSGHRRLFNSFKAIDAGMVSGPGSVLLWSLEHFALAFVGGRVMRNLVKGVVRLIFGWVKYFDYFFVNRPASMDGAGCTFLFGFKLEKSIDDEVIIENYSGAINLKHT